MVQNEWLWPTSGEFGAQRKVMWNCTICLSCGSAIPYFKNLPLTNAVALLLFFLLCWNKLSVYMEQLGKGELI